MEIRDGLLEDREPRVGQLIYQLSNNEGGEIQVQSYLHATRERAGWGARGRRLRSSTGGRAPDKKSHCISNGPRIGIQRKIHTLK
jgi:hypothetical protein